MKKFLPSSLFHTDRETLVNIQHLNVQNCGILGLQGLLLGIKQRVPFAEHLKRAFHTQGEFLLCQLIGCLRSLFITLRRDVVQLSGLRIQERGLYRFLRSSFRFSVSNPDMFLFNLAFFTADLRSLLSAIA